MRTRGLWVGDHHQIDLPDGVTDELWALFTDDMLCCDVTPADSRDGWDYAVYSLRGAGEAIADRLSLFGYTESATMQLIDEALADRRVVFPTRALEEKRRAELEYLEAFTAADWVQAFREAPEEGRRYGIGEISWLLGLLSRDPRLALRATLLAVPEAEVTLTFDEGPADIDPGPEMYFQCRKARANLHETVTAHAPIVVLTEGRSDVAFLEPALALLYPHLTDLVRFMDWGGLTIRDKGKPEGGAAPLVKTVRAFAAVRIANPVVALFDNDAAAWKELLSLPADELPANIKALQYPPLEFAKTYPTPPPPNVDRRDRTGQQAWTDINGLAGSIELYLGRDVLRGPDGMLPPVKWGGLQNGTRHQGVLDGKKGSAISKAYEAKLAAAQSDPSLIAHQDWEGMRAVLSMVIHAFD